MIKTSIFAAERFSLVDKIIYHGRRQMIIDYLPRGKKVCDLGCGETGYFLRELGDVINSGIGFDLEVNPAFETNRVHLHRVDLEKPLPLSNHSVGVVFSLAVIEHLNNSRAHIKEAWRILEPGGKLILTTPSILAKPILEILSTLRLINRVSIDDHKYYFNKNELKELCQKAGFLKIKFRYFQAGCNQLVIAEKA